MFFSGVLRYYKKEKLTEDKSLAIIAKHSKENTLIKKQVIIMKLIKAFIVASLAHRGQVDKAGKKYVKHAIRVSRKVKSKQAKMVALLHDVVEDTCKTIEDIEKMFGRETAFQVSCLTKIKGEVTEEYIKRVKQSPVSIEVKLADLLDNMNVFRLKKVEEADLVRLKKYLSMYYELAKEINTV